MALRSKLTDSTDDQTLHKWMTKNLVYEGKNKGFLRHPTRVVSDKKAHCWEACALEVKELESLGYKCKTLMVTTHNASATHTAVIFIKNFAYYWFEWAWHSHVGIHGPFKSERLALKEVIDNFEHEHGKKIFAFYGHMRITKTDNEKSYFERAEKCREVKLPIVDPASLKELPLTQENVEKYKPQHRNLGRIRTTEGYKGIILVDKGDKFVAILSVYIPKKYIQAVDVHPDYQNQGVGLYLVDVAVRRFNAIYLAVRRTNHTAIRLYENYGFKLYRHENEVMDIMKYDSSRKFSLESW